MTIRVAVSGDGGEGISSDIRDALHSVKIAGGTVLESIVGAGSGEVNSSHHQSVDRPAPRLRISALSEDGVVEGLEWKEPEGKPWMLLVQWHPERMADVTSPFSQRIADAYLKEIASFALSNNRPH